MSESFTLQGRVVDGAGLDEVRALLREHPDWSRWRLSRHLARQWDWRNGAGRLKDMAARSLLLKLEGRGLVQLPPRRRRPPNRMRLVPKGGSEIAPAPIEDALAQLHPLRLAEVSGHPRHRQTLALLLHRHHYLSYTGAVGENLQYLVWDRFGRVLAAAVFGAAAWQCGPRDRWLGWDAPTRQAKLQWICGQTRFLIPPWVKVKHLASHLLAQWSGSLAADWQAKYGHRVWLVESFVDAQRFAGTSYRAANWHCVGLTQGRSRQDSRHQLKVPRKQIYLCPLHPRYRQALNPPLQPPPPPVASPGSKIGPGAPTGL